MKYYYIILGLTCIYIFSSCEGCFKKIYSVHEEVEYLHINIDDSTKTPSHVLRYVDFVLTKDTSRYGVDSLLNGIFIGKDNRVIHFKIQPEEYYFMSFNTAPCWIKGIFNKKIDAVDWIYDIKKINSVEINRIRFRFTNEVLQNVN